MKWLILIVLLLTTIDPGDIRKINVAKAEAKKAYLAGDFQTAIARYRYLLDSMQVDEDEVRMNLANAYFQANDTTQALNAYLPLTQSKNAKLKSVAHQQMGVLNNRQGKLEEALTEFKQALKTDPTNEDARYNYEMVKKKIEEKKKQQQQDQKDKQQQDQNKDSKDQNDQNKDQQKQEQENK
ncbi:MAG: tetratricopeptide repeat protein, partial [Bacteroidota bacterium]